MSRLLLSHPDAAHCRDPTAASSYPANRRLKSSGIDLAQLVGRVHRHIEVTREVFRRRRHAARGENQRIPSTVDAENHATVQAYNLLRQILP